jgi:hypothetical protein
MTGAPELKPCPFCGGEADILTCFVMCLRCGSRGAIRGEEESRLVDPIEAWNRRAPSPAVQRVVEEMRVSMLSDIYPNSADVRNWITLLEGEGK